MSAPATPFLEARDFLLRHREDYDAACRGFRWPRLDRFNWALDYFDVLAAGNTRAALLDRRRGRRRAKLSFAELSERSDRVANRLRALGVKRGDRILLMLGNVVPLWETMLAAMKLGAVVIPATTLLTARRPRRPLRARPRAPRRHRRRRRRQIRRASRRSPASPSAAPRRAGAATTMPADAPARFTPDGADRAPPIRCCSISPPAPRRSPSWCCTATRAIRSAILSTMYWLGLQPGDMHLNISSPGWAKHAWSCFFAPWNAGATVFMPTSRASTRARCSTRSSRSRRHHASARRRRSGGC